MDGGIDWDPVAASILSTVVAIVMVIVNFLQAKRIKTFETKQTKEIDSFRAELQSKSFEQQTSFANLYQKRVEAVEALSPLLLEVERRLGHLMHSDSRDLFELLNMLEEAKEAINTLLRALHTKIVYFEPAQYERLTVMIAKFYRIPYDYVGETVEEYKGGEPITREHIKIQWKHMGELHKLRDDIFAEFRQMIGLDVSNQSAK